MKKLLSILMSTVMLTQIVAATEFKSIENNNCEILNIFDDNRFIVKSEQSDGTTNNGVIDLNGNVIIPLGDYTIDSTNGFFEVINQEKSEFSYYDYNGNVISQDSFYTLHSSKDGVCFERIGNLQESKFYVNKTQSITTIPSDIIIHEILDSGIIYAEQHGKYGLLNYAGEIVVPFEYDDYNELISYRIFYAQTFLAVQKDNKWGVIDTNGNIIVPFEFDKIEEFNGEFLITSENSMYAAFDIDGSEIIEYSPYKLRFTANLTAEGMPSDDAILAYGDDDTNALYNLQGDEIVSMDEYDAIMLWLTVDYFSVRTDDKRSILDSQGNLILPLEYKNIYNIDTENGYIYVRKDDKDLVVSMENEVIFEFDYYYLYADNNFIVTKETNNGPYHIYNENFEEIDYGNITNIEHVGINFDLKLLEANNKYGIIDTNNNIIVDFVYDSLNTDMIANNYVIAKQNEKWGIIDLNNNVIVPFEYDEISFSQKDDILLLKDGVYSVINDFTSYIDIAIQPTDSTVLVNGQPANMQAYNINGYNYFKLRDIAYSLDETTCEFNVSWDSNDESVNIELNQSYIPVGGEMIVSDNDNKIATKSLADIYANSILYRGDYSNVKFIDAYNIADNNYIKLRDIGLMIGFEVNYDETTNTIEIITE